MANRRRCMESTRKRVESIRRIRNNEEDANGVDYFSWNLDSESDYNSKNHKFYWLDDF